MSKKDKVVPVRFSLSDYELLEKKATESGLKISTFIREVVLAADKPRSRTVVPEVTRQTYEELHKIGVNINQAIRALNTIAKGSEENSSTRAGISDMAAVQSFERWGNQLQEQISQLRAELGGK